MSDFSFPQLPANAQRYQCGQSYAWNYDHAPPIPAAFHGGNGGFRLCGLEVSSPIGVAAGPLLNGRWVLHYAAAGFDVLTYKTVRSRARPCYALPNLQPIVASRPLNVTSDSRLAAAAAMTGSWAVSFGMPSADPNVWRADIEATRRRLPSTKKLSVSVVATAEPDWTIDQVGADYAQCARWAVESGADFVEVNFSCPNVLTCDGQLYQHPHQAAQVAAQVKDVLGSVPLLIKMGPVEAMDLITSLVQHLHPVADALVMINCIPAKVAVGQQPLFDGERRGIAGDAIRNATRSQIEQFHAAIVREEVDLQLVAVGGVRDKSDAVACLQRGAQAVQVATSTMWRGDARPTAPGD